MDILISGSLAYDRIMDFPGKFQDHILPEKIHILNVCFLVNGLEEKFGGTAGNIAYNLALLGEKPTVISAVGRDFDRYAKRLEDLGLPLIGLRTIDEELTAGAYITTDKSDNQITGFNPGAMKHQADFDFTAVNSDDALAIIAPGNQDDMMTFAREYRDRKIPYVFDPGQQIPVFSGEQLSEALTGASLLVSNDYELEMIKGSTGLELEDLVKRVGAIITTLGEKGSVIVDEKGRTEVPAAPVARTLDPTGAGDAFRAGLIKGLIQGKSLVEAACLGSVTASWCVECHGTQDHHFSQEDHEQRHREHFGPQVWAGPLGAICHNTFAK